MMYMYWENVLLRFLIIISGFDKLDFIQILPLLAVTALTTRKASRKVLYLIKIILRTVHRMQYLNILQLRQRSN